MNKKYITCQCGSQLWIKQIYLPIAKTDTMLEKVKRFIGCGGWTELEIENVLICARCSEKLEDQTDNITFEHKGE